MSWRPGGRKFELSQLHHKLSMLKEGEHYRDDLGPAVKDRSLIRNKDPTEHGVDQSKQMLQNMLLSSRMHRDFNLDNKNPREELAKFSKYVDQIPAFDQPPLTMFEPYDYAGRQQIAMVIAGRSHYVMEESKFNNTLDNEDNSLEPQPERREGDRRMLWKKQRELERQNLMETTSSL